MPHCLRWPFLLCEPFAPIVHIFMFFKIAIYMQLCLLTAVLHCNIFTHLLFYTLHIGFSKTAKVPVAKNYIVPHLLRLPFINALENTVGQIFPQIQPKVNICRVVYMRKPSMHTVSYPLICLPHFTLFRVYVVSISRELLKSRILVKLMSECKTCIIVSCV